MKSLFFSSDRLTTTSLSRKGVFLGVVLYIASGIFCIILLLRALFPTLFFSFQFRTPDSSRNTFLDPRTETGLLIRNGKIDSSSPLIGSFGTPGNFSEARFSFELEKKSNIPSTTQFSIRRSFRGFFLPEDSPLPNQDKPILARDANQNIYLKQNSLYHRFVSEKAFLTRYPKEYLSTATPLPDDAKRDESWVGFRPGTLLSFADGVFMVTSDSTIRPFGDATIFLTMGYHFEDVVPATEEEIGIYKREKILLLGSEHPTGTLFLDTENDKLFVIDDKTKRLVSDTTLRNFLLSKNTPIRVSSSHLNKQTDCIPIASWTRRSYSCSSNISDLSDVSGSDFEVQLNTSDPIDIATITIELHTTPNKTNLNRFVGQIKERLLNRFSR